MQTPESHNAIVSDLIRRGLPAEYAERVTHEFIDHQRDLAEELQATGLSESQAAAESAKRLGTARTLVTKTVREYQRRYWCGRWPLLTFLFAPIPLLLVICTAIGAALFSIGSVLEKCGVSGTHEFDGNISIGERLLELTTLSVLFFIAPAIAMYLLARLARRAALTWKWLIVSACVLGLSIGMVRCEFAQPTSKARLPNGSAVPADQQVLILGAPIFAPTFLAAWKWYTHDLQQIGQVLLPLAIVGAAALRTRQLSLRTERLYHAA